MQTLSCLFFLLASSILAFIFIGQQTSVASAVLLASPNKYLRAGDRFSLSGKGFGPGNKIIFTYDVNKPILTDSNSKQQFFAYADSQGAFTVFITVPTDWGSGDHIIHATDSAQRMSVSTRITIEQASSEAPHLTLSNTRIDLDTASYQSSITLNNPGGGQITWEAQRDTSWLTATPRRGTFKGSELVTISVNRSGLSPQSYTGHLTFTSKESGDNQTLTVTMQVKPSPASLNISTPALSFSAPQGQSAGSQSITLQNSGGVPLDWTSTAVTGDGTPWLMLDPAYGQKAGTYQGTLTFSYGSVSKQVTITLTVASPPTPTISITNTSTTPHTSTVLQITNSGAATLNRAATPEASATWLSVDVSSGTLAAGTSTVINVQCDSSQLTPGTYTATLIISDSDPGAPVSSQTVQVTLVVQ
jgi:hypothetical protein